MFNLNFTGAPAGRRGRTPRAGARGPGRSRRSPPVPDAPVCRVCARRPRRCGTRSDTCAPLLTIHESAISVEQRNNIYKFQFELLFVSARCADVSGFAPLVLTVRERVIRSSTSSLGIATASASGILMCQHRQHKARTKARRPGTPMYTDQCCEDMLKARTPHTTMQMHQKQNAENAADQSMPKRGLWESNEAAISPETMRRGCSAPSRAHTERCPRSVYCWAEVPCRISGPERAQGLTPSARRVLSASSPSDIRRGRVAQHAGAAEEAVADDRLARKLGLRPV